MQGTIEAVKKSTSGKSLGVLIGGTWYSTKNWELEGMQGKSITFQTSVQEFSGGGQCHWLNDYTVDGASTTPADQAFDAAYAQRQPPPQPTPYDQHQPRPTQAPQAPHPSKMDREASIVAQALTKAVTCANAQQAWETYVFLYNKVLEWNPGDFDDSLPY